MNDKGAETVRHGKLQSFTLGSFIWRFALTLMLVLVTYNPSGYSVYHWISDDFADPGLGAVHYFVGILLVAGWSVLWIATWRALELFGVVLGTLVIAALIWLLIDIGVLAADSGTALAWIVLVGIAVLFSIGLSWAHIWRRLTGQLEVDTD